MFTRFLLVPLRSGRAIWLSLALIFGITLVLTWAQPVRAAALYEPPNGTTYLGVGSEFNAIPSFDRVAGIADHPAIWNRYISASANQSFTSTLAWTARTPGLTPLLSWSVPMAGGAVVSGSENSYIDQQVAIARAYGKPMFIRLDWEMNGGWFAGYGVNTTTPELYRQSWHYIVKRFTAAPNVAFVWCPNEGIPNSQKLNWKAWYPGDTSVDWVGLDSYPEYSRNPHSSLHMVGGLEDLAQFAEAHHKPAMLAEWARGRRHTPLGGPDTTTTIDLVFQWAMEHPASVKALVYFDFNGSTAEGPNHSLENNPIAAAAFRAYSADRSRWLTTIVAPAPVSTAFRLTASASAAKAPIGAPIQLTATAQMHDGTPVPIFCRWALPDGTTHNGCTLTAIPTAAGPFAATVTATSRTGQVKTVTVTTIVQPPLPKLTVSIRQSAQSVTAGTPVSFTVDASEVNNDPAAEAPTYQYAWSFPGGRTDTSKTVGMGSAATSNPGTYRVAVTVTDKHGTQVTASATVIVTPTPLHHPMAGSGAITSGSDRGGLTDRVRTWL